MISPLNKTDRQSTRDAEYGEFLKTNGGRSPLESYKKSDAGFTECLERDDSYGMSELLLKENQTSVSQRNNEDLVMKKRMVDLKKAARIQETMQASVVSGSIRKALMMSISKNMLEEENKMRAKVVHRNTLLFKST